MIAQPLKERLPPVEKSAQRAAEFSLR